MERYQIELNSALITRLLAVGATLLVAAGTVTQTTALLTGHPRIYGLVRLFYLNTMQNVPTFFSTALLFFAALLLGLIAALKQQQTGALFDPWGTSRVRLSARRR